MKKLIKLEKVQKQVKAKLPTAVIHQDYDGLYFLSNGEDDLTEEYFIPHSNTEEDAWRQGLYILRTTQNFNRTHPLRTEMIDFAKDDRITERKSRNKLREKEIER